MAVKLRLKRMGKRHRPFYRLHAIDSRTRRDGRGIEELGFYDPVTKDETRVLKLNKERIEYWLSVGAQPSDTVRGLIRKIGVDVEPVKRPTHPTRAEREAVAKAAEDAAKAAEEAAKAKAEAAKAAAEAAKAKEEVAKTEAEGS